MEYHFHHGAFAFFGTLLITFSAFIGRSAGHGRTGGQKRDGTAAFRSKFAFPMMIRFKKKMEKAGTETGKTGLLHLHCWSIFLSKSLDLFL
jgi:hypothetical protein